VITSLSLSVLLVFWSVAFVIYLRCPRNLSPLLVLETVSISVGQICYWVSVRLVGPYWDLVLCLSIILRTDICLEELLCLSYVYLSSCIDCPSSVDYLLPVILVATPYYITGIGKTSSIPVHSLAN